MKRVKLRAVDDGRLVAEHHSLAIIEAVDHHGPGISESDLENGVFVFPPPFLDYTISEIKRSAAVKLKQPTSHTVAWSSPSSRRWPTTGKAPGISGIPLMLGTSVEVRSFQRVRLPLDGRRIASCSPRKLRRPEPLPQQD